MNKIVQSKNGEKKNYLECFEKTTVSIRKQIQKKFHTDGLSAIYHLAFSLLCGILALFFAILFRLLKPLVIIRIRCLYSERIGHFAANTEIYLCEKDRGINIPNQRFVDIWYYNSCECNMQLKKMWNRILKIWPSRLSLLIVLINSHLPDGELFTIPWRGNQDRDVNNVLEFVPPHLSFTQDEEEFGRITLDSMGLSSHDLFVCFIGRDPNYLKLINSNLDTSYHDYRNIDINNYIPAAEEMVNRGYYAIRMGLEVANALASNNPGIIDYATNGQRSDFMDIYLGAKCHFFISVGTGVDNIAGIFRRPILFVNYAPLEYVPSWDKNNIFIPKKHWLDKEQRLMSFREIIESGAGRFLCTNQYLEMGITLIENTPEEIREVAIEMEERLKGIWVTTEEDEELQRRFWSLYKPSELHGKIYSRIGAAFVRKYQTLLD
ncbi:MAG: TIGR04372 family glycosyltransferase [Methanoregula sp.]